MTNFLRADSLAEKLRQIHDELLALRAALAERTATEGCADCTAQDLLGVDHLLELAGELADFLERLPCQPLVYTGDEPTEHMIALMDRLLMRYRMEQG